MAVKKHIKQTTKTLLTLSALAGLSFTTAQAATTLAPNFYSEDFGTSVTPDDPDLVQDFRQQIGTGTLVSSHSALDYTQFAVQGDTGFSTDTGVLHLDSNTGGGTAATRMRSASVWIDTSTFTAGSFSVSFVVTNFTDGPGGDVAFNVFEGSGLDTGYITFRTGQNNGSGAFPSVTNTANGAPATFALIATPVTTIAGNGNVSVAFELTEAGTAGDYQALSWTQSRGLPAGGVSDTLDIDNINVVPEPGTYALIGGMLALSYVMLRRRRA